MSKRNSITITNRNALALTFLLTARLASGAACCSSNAAAPALISGDDRAQLSIGIGASGIVGDAPATGTPIFRADNDSDRLQSLRLDGAILVSVRWQVGASLPFLRHAVDRPGENSTATALGDVRADLAYEFLPEWNYRPWIPKGYAFLQVIVPNATSIYEGEAPGEVGAMGRGFYTFALGALLVKQGPRFDGYLLPEVHYSLARTFAHAGENVRVVPGLGSSVALGIGYSPGGGNFRFGIRVQPAYSAPMEVTSSTGVNRTSYQLIWDTGLEASYLVAENWSLTASYNDQTLLGPATSASLSRGVVVGVLHRWDR